MTLIFSASEAYSCRGWSPTPMLSMASSFVFETLGVCPLAGLGSLTGVRFSLGFPGLWLAATLVEAKDRTACRGTRRATPDKRARTRDTGADMV